MNKPVTPTRSLFDQKNPLPYIPSHHTDLRRTFSQLALPLSRQSKLS
jgi:hypothetical protein